MSSTNGSGLGRRGAPSVFFRLVTWLGVLATLSGTLPPALAASQPGGRGAPGPAAPPAAAAPPGATNQALERVAPVSAAWGSHSAAVLFDGDARTSLRTAGEAVFRVGFAGPRRIAAVGAHGRADGWLSVSTLDPAGRETPVAGLQQLDLGGLPLRWNRFRAPQPAAAADAVLLRWRPRRPDAALRELELFGLGAAAPARRATAGAALADRIVSAPPAEAVEAWAAVGEMSVSSAEVGLAGAASFPVELPVDPRLVRRAFLIYELAGLDHWTAAVRQVNGFSVHGGYGAETSRGGGGLQVEEISPEWLFHGDNEIRFLPLPDPAAAGYRVRRLRVVVVPGAGGDASDPEAAPRAAGGDLPRLTDGDQATGIRGRQGTSFLTLPLDRGAQPASLSLRVEEAPSGRLRVMTLRDDGRDAPGEELDVAGLRPGWHTLPLDRLAGGGRAVRVIWDPGREGVGLISEVRLASSPAPEGRPRRLVVSAPLHGECVDHRVHLRGFVAGAEDEPAPPRLWFGGAAMERGVAADGAISLVGAEPAAVRGRAWSIELRARFADGGEVTETVPVDTCGDRPTLARATRRPSGPPPLVEDEGAPFAKRVAAAKGDVLEMEGARLQIPAGALERDTRITVRPLVDSQVPPLDDPLMENVMSERGAFRLGPHNLRFKQPIKISVPYDRARVRKGLEPGELGVFYFDEEEGRWRRLPSVASASRDVLVAETTHFTDFMVATLPQPETPAASQNAPNMLADIKAGNPTSGITMIQPPGAAPDGSAHLTFPIEVPPGRNGMQPNLALQYDSSAGNGLYGMGWSLPISNIQVDTKFGTPTYADELSQRFLLDGDELVPVAGGAPVQNERDYRRRVERSFERIVRMDYWGEKWRVTDRNGVVSHYGLYSKDLTGPSVIAIDSDGDSRPAFWGIARATDLLGNSVEYNYARAEDGPPPAPGAPSDHSSRWQDLRLGTIVYTSVFDAAGTRTSTGQFRVLFVYEPRPDPFSNSRMGREVRTRTRVRGIASQYFDFAANDWVTFRRYDLGYVTGEFGKSLLKTITTFTDGTIFYKHELDYQKLPRDSQNRVQFGSAQEWGRLPAGDGGALGKGSSTSSGMSGFGGVGPVECYPHVGAGMSGGSSSDNTMEAFADINGDGLPDVVRASGASYLNGFASSGGVVNRSAGTFTSASTGAVQTLGEGKSSSRTYSLGVHFPGELGGDGSVTSSRASETRALVDMNGDGMLDLFGGNRWECNKFPAALCPTGGTAGPFGPVFNLAGDPTAGYKYADEPADGGGSSFATQMVARWTAPFDGTVRIDGSAARATVAPPPPPPPAINNTPPHDAVTAMLYSRTYSGTSVVKQTMWQRTFAGVDAQACFPGRPGGTTPNTACNTSPISNLTVKAGDEYYFVVGSTSGNQRNTLAWNPSVTYTNVACPDPNNKITCMTTQREAFGPLIYDYDMADDFRLNGGIVAVPWVSASADTRPDGSQPTRTRVRITGSIIKAPTTDDVRFQIVRLRTNAAPVVVWPASGQPLSMTAAQASTFSFDANNVLVDVMGKWVSKRHGSDTQWTIDGDQLVFQVLADAPIDPGAITWKPVVTYQNYCYPDPKEQQRLYQASRATPSPNQVPIICTDTPSTVIGNASQAVEVQYPAFRYKPSRAGAPASPPAPATATGLSWTAADSANHTFSLSGTINVTPGPRGVDPDSTDRGQVVALVQTKNKLLAKQTIVLGTDGSARSVAFARSNLAYNGADPLYFTLLLYGDHAVTWLPTTAHDTGNSFGHTPTVHVLAEPPLPGRAAPAPYGGRLVDPMSGGFHQWTFGVFNGSYSFDPDSIKLQYTSTSDPTSAYFPPTPAVAGVPPNGDTTLAGSTGPVWRGRAYDDYIAAGYFHPSYSGSGVLRASPFPGSAFRRSQSTAANVAGNVYVSVQSGGSTSVSELDLIDFNGDGLPDLMGLDRVGRNRLFTTGAVDFDTITGLTFPSASFRVLESTTGRWGLGLGSIASQLVDKPHASGRTKMLASTLPSFGLGYGITGTTTDLVDVNGDGLMDLVSKPGLNQIQVRLGRGFVPGVWSIPQNNTFQRTSSGWAMPEITDGLSQATELQYAMDGDPLRAQDNASNSLQVNIMGIGGGVAFGASRTMIDMVDINGDGLPDRVMKKPSQPGELRVQINTGLGFAAPEVWALPAWRKDGADIPIESSGLGGLGLGGNDALAFTQSKSTAISGGAFIPIPIPIILVCLVAELSTNSDSVDSNTQMMFQDVNGDGYPDQVFKQNDLTTVPGATSGTIVYAKLNPTGAANLLTHVEGPVGGSFDIEYARAGNEVDILRHVDMPMNRWVMSAVHVHSQPKDLNGVTRNTWNADPSRRAEMKYAGGFYSRADRDFLGFATVTATNASDQSTVEETYDTSDVYHKGLLVKRVLRDAQGRVLDVEDRQYETRALQAAQGTTGPRAANWVVERLRTQRSYEIGNANPVTREEARGYDNALGEMTSFEDRGDTSTTEDDVKYTLGYFRDAEKNLSKVNLIVARDAAAALLGQRSATYSTTGLMKTVTNVLRGGRNPATGATYNGPTDPAAANYQTANPTWTYNHHTYGMVRYFADPNGYVVSVSEWDAYNVHPKRYLDSLGYQWSQVVDMATGIPTETTDVNGAKTTYELDAHKRLGRVLTTRLAGEPAVERLNVTYRTNIDTVSPPYAMVRYLNGESSQKLALADGWGRVIQTKQKSVADDGAGNSVAGVTLSGRVAYDGRGRVASVGQPAFRSGFDLDIELTFDGLAGRNPTTFQYDARSRTTSVVYPAPRPPTVTAYDTLAVTPGVYRKRRTITDSNGEVVRALLDAAGRVLTVEERNAVGGSTIPVTLTTEYEYDPMGRLREVWDAKENVTSTEWDTLGHMVTLNSPDTGVTRYDYDLNGNLGRKQNANGKLIKYVRTQNRLDKIDYPDSADVVYAYGAPGATGWKAGRITSVTDETGVEAYLYDDLGNVTRTDWTPAPMTGQPTPPTYTTIYSWDQVFGIVRSIQIGADFTRYGYDVNGRVKYIKAQRGAAPQFDVAGKILYDEFGRRTRMELGNGAVTRYTYEPTTRRLDTLQTDGGGLQLQRLDYTYDAVGNVKQVVDAVPTPAANLPPTTILPGPSTRTFNYDSLHQLKSATGQYTGVGSSGGRTYGLTMTYDEIGNIKAKIQLDQNRAAPGATPQTVGATTHSLGYAYGSTRPHAATTIGGQTNTYDADGNQLTSLGSFGVGRTMTWNEEDRLRSIAQEGVTTTFLYRPGAERGIKRGTAETFYVNPHLTDRRGVSTTRHFMLGNERIATAVKVGSTVKTVYFHADHLQSSTLMTDDTGTIQQHTQYLPFGETWFDNVRNGDPSNRTPYLFNGKERDETGLYYFSARYYDPATAQWKSADPALPAYVKGSPNSGMWRPANLGVFGYAYNSPVTVRDPSGLAPTTIKEVEITVDLRPPPLTRAANALADVKNANTVLGIEQTLVDLASQSAAAGQLEKELGAPAQSLLHYRGPGSKALAEALVRKPGDLVRPAGAVALARVGQVAWAAGTALSALDTAAAIERGDTAGTAVGGADTAVGAAGTAASLGAFNPVTGALVGAFAGGYSIGGVISSYTDVDREVMGWLIESYLVITR